MTPNVQLDVDHLRKLGVTLLPSFLGGAVCVIARYDLPSLSFPSDLGSERLDAIIELYNCDLRDKYRGCGYYGSCPPGSDDSAGETVYVLFADKEFYDDFRNGSVIAPGNA